MLIREFGQLVEALGDVFEPVVTPGVERLQFRRGEDDDPGEGLAVQGSAKGRRDRNPPLAVYLVEISRRKQRQRRIPKHARDYRPRPGKPHARRPARASMNWD